MVASGKVDVDGAEVALEPCGAAVAAGDGRELWQHLPNRQISNAMGKKCIGVAGDAVVLVGCDNNRTWEMRGDGQVKLNSSGQYCLSQKGPAVGLENAATHSAISASSSADVAAHGANMAVDGSSNTFWASALDAEGPVELIADLGEKRRLNTASLEWEFPAKSFIISVSVDGEKWTEVYATDNNILSSNTISMGSVSASKVRVVMHEAVGAFQGHMVYGLKDLALYTDRLQTIIEDCSLAAKSVDARDKYFETYVAGFAPCSSNALRSELPSLEAAQASVSSVIAELLEVLPKMNSCSGAAAFMIGSSHIDSQPTGRATGDALSGNAASLISQYVDNQNAIGTVGVRALLREARRVIIAARGALF